MPLADDAPELLDAEGFLREGTRWDRNLAARLAASLGVTGMTQAHWAVVCCLRGHYLRQGTLPWEAHVCRELGLEKGCIHHLFGGPLTAWRIAGLPNPGEEARAYLLNQEPPRSGAGSPYLRVPPEAPG